MTTIEAPIHFAESMEAYLASEALGGGSLHTLVERSPKHFRHGLKFNQTSAAFTLGTLAHTAILEADEWWADYIQGPRGDGRTKIVKAELAAIKEAHPHATIVKPDDYDKVIGMAKAVEELGVIPDDAAREISHYWTGAGGLALKCRPDAIDYDARIHYNLKTTRDASERAFHRDALKLGYVHSVGHYHNGFLAVHGEVFRHVIVAVESEPPHDVGVFDVGKDEIAWGAAEMDQAIRLAVRLQKDGVYPGYKRMELRYEWMRRGA